MSELEEYVLGLIRIRDAMRTLGCVGCDIPQGMVTMCQRLTWRVESMLDARWEVIQYARRREQFRARAIAAQGQPRRPDRNGALVAPAVRSST